MTAVPDSWKLFFRLGITRDDAGSEVQFAGVIEDITGMDWGEKDIEGIPTGSGGRITKFIPMTDESMTLKVYPVDANIDGGGFIQHLHPQFSAGLVSNDTTVPIVVENSQERIKHKVVLLFSTKLPDAASTSPDTGEPSYRIQIINAYVTASKASFDGKHYSAEVTIKWTPFDKDGNGNKREESTDTTAPLATATTSVSSWA